MRHTRRVLQALACSTLATAHADGGEVLGEFHLGQTMPTFKQTLTYDASTLIPPTPGVTIQSQGALQLDASGGRSYSGGLTWLFLGPVGLEARIDSLSANLDATGARYDVTLQLPAPLPPLTGRLDLGSRDLALERVQPISLNLRVLTPGPVRLSVSGGLSHLGVMRVGGTLTGSLAANVAGVTTPSLGVQVALRAEAPPEQTDQGQYGANLGLGVQIGLGAHLALSAETRGFLFRERTLSWSSAALPQNPLEDALQRDLLARLEPIRFTPTFFSVNVGLALRF